MVSFRSSTGIRKDTTDSNGIVRETKYSAKNYLIGLRYLTESDTTFILEYYRNGTGFSAGEMEDLFFVSAIKPTTGILLQGMSLS